MGTPSPNPLFMFGAFSDVDSHVNEILQGFPSRDVIAGKSTLPNRVYDGLAHMTWPWLFMTSPNPGCVSLKEDQIHQHFLDLCARRWVVNDPALGFTVCLSHFPRCFVAPDGLLENDFQHSAEAVYHLLGVREADQHEDKNLNTHTHTRSEDASPACNLTLLWFLSYCQLQLDSLPNSAACLSTLALPLCSLARTVSVLLGQNTHIITVCFIKERQ